MNQRWLVPLLAAILAAGCTRGSFSQKAQESAPAVFRYPIVTSPTTLDPAMVQDGDTIDAVQQTFEGLVGWSPDNQPEPRLAESIEVSPDGTLYTFKIKPNAKFSSGRALTAEDFKWSIERACDPKFNSPTVATYLSDIVGVKERLAGKADSVSGIKVVDPQTLTIQIDRPRPYFLGKLTYPVSWVLDKDQVKVPGKEITNVAEMVGTGPFVLAEFVPDQIIRFKANPEYHGGAPKITGIERPVVKDAITRLNMFKQGEVDLVPLERQDLTAVNADASLKPQLKLFDRPAMWYLGMNTNVYPVLENRDVRRAIAMAVDADAIVNTTLGGVNARAYGIVPPGVFGSREKGKFIPYNPEEARKLLASAGYPNGRGVGKLEMTFRESRPDIALAAQKIASDLKKNLNLDVQLRQMEWRAYLEKHNSKTMPFFHMRWGADYLDAENFLSTLLASYGPENKVNYKNPRYDELCARADESQDPEERKRLYAEAEDIVLQDAVFVPIYFQRDAELVSPRVKGMRESLFGHLPHTTVSVER